MVDPHLQQVKLHLAGYHANGIVARGEIDLHPQVVSVSGTTATVKDCSFSKSMLYYAATGQLVPPITQPEYDGVNATLTEVAPGVWKVADQTATDGKC